MLSDNELKRGRTSDFFKWYIEVIGTIVMFTVFPFPILALPGCLIAGMKGWLFTIITLLVVTFIIGMCEYILPDEETDP